MIAVCLISVLYFGPVAPGTRQLPTVPECHQVDETRAKAIVGACAKEGAERCEVIIDPRKPRTVTIERKIIVDESGSILVIRT